MAAGIMLDQHDYLHLDLPRRPLRLYPGVGGAQMELTLRISRQSEHEITRSFQVSAVMLVSATRHHNQRMVCRLMAEDVVTPTLRSHEVRLVGFVTYEQLRVIDELRQGNHMWVILRPSVSSVEGDPPALVSRRGDELPFDLAPGEWADLVESVDAGSYVEVLVPLAAGEEHATAVRRLATARGLMREGKIEEALGETRKALEVVRTGYNSSHVVRAWEQKVRQGQDPNPRKRPINERWAYQIEDLFSLLSGAAHDDEVTAAFEYSYADAATLLAATAGMLSRLAEDRRRI